MRYLDCLKKVDSAPKKRGKLGVAPSDFGALFANQMGWVLRYFLWLLKCLMANDYSWQLCGWKWTKNEAKLTYIDKHQPQSYDHQKISHSSCQVGMRHKAINIDQHPNWHTRANSIIYIYTYICVYTCRDIFVFHQLHLTLVDTHSSPQMGEMDEFFAGR